MPDLTPEQLLVEINSLIADMPPFAILRQDLPENARWIGRSIAVMRCWSRTGCTKYESEVRQMRSGLARPVINGMHAMLSLLYQAQYELELKTDVQPGVAISQGEVYEYFNALRKILEAAKEEVFIVDSWVNPDFVASYFPQVPPGVSVRILTLNKMLPKLNPAVEMFKKQNELNVEVRAVSEGLHDRYIIVDRLVCYQSGASFKDGGKNAATTLIPVVDLFRKVADEYEARWQQAKQP